MKKNTWNLQEMQKTLIKDSEQRINQGFAEIADTEASAAPVSSASAEGKEATATEASASSKEEPTKGVQTYIPISQYRRLNDIKLTRRENIATLVAQAIELWLDVQEGKRKCT